MFIVEHCSDVEECLQRVIGSDHRVRAHFKVRKTESRVGLVALSCRVSTYLFYISMHCSIFFPAGLGVCRSLVLAGHIRLQNQLACRWARLLCLGVWVGSRPA
ncbi:hypothetical protein AAFF_G00186630 [Aldrovandia affinis]|uniref:Uncharacterized protein n=1 Tax=Aldrovandia affinis TaxID=143900 RepID=A0AAD7SZQ9_9TELE|nr:hypothetical protein AAFF_G00186630 [Aldrovandia affinis]